jgi:SAM-dependent methyltransferase
MVKCLACASERVEPWAVTTDVEYKTVSDKFTYYRCQMCAALTIDPVPSARLGEIYPVNYYSFGQERHGLVQSVKNWIDRRWFARAAAVLDGDALAALDVGGGAGHQLDALRAADPRFRRTVVVDLDARAQSLAEARGHEYVRGRIEDVSLNGSFDLVLLLNLIEHVENPLAVLTRVADLLTPGGMVLVKTPNYRSLDADIFRHHDWGGYHSPRHFVIFTRPSFSTLVERAGLDVTRWDYTQGAPFWAVSVLAWLDRRGLVTITRDRPSTAHPLFGPLAAGFATFDFVRGLAAPQSQMTFTLRRVKT